MASKKVKSGQKEIIKKEVASVQVTAQPAKESLYLPFHDFPYLERYRAQFAFGDNDVAFPYKGKIYSDNELPSDLVEHEKVHFRQQDEMGADAWVEEYLANPAFRLKVEVEAYRHQLSLYTPLMYSLLLGNIAKVLSSAMYGNIVTYNEARGLLSKK